MIETQKIRFMEWIGCEVPLGLGLTLIFLSLAIMITDLTPQIVLPIFYSGIGSIIFGFTILGIQIKGITVRKESN